MPYINEHAARIKDPKQYNRFRRQNNKLGRGIHVIWGIKNGPPVKIEMQALRFSTKYFTEKQAKDWLKEHDIKYILFESAVEKPKNNKYILRIVRHKNSK